MPTITDQSIQADWGPTTWYSPSGSPWWTQNSDWNGAAPGTQWIDYNISTFPNGTVIHWNYGAHTNPANVWGYPAVNYGTVNTQNPPNGTLPANWGQQVGTLCHFNMTWDTSLAGQAQDPYAVLAETKFDGNPEYEFGIFLKLYPAGINYVKKNHTGYHFDLGGLQGEVFPDFWRPGSLAIVPDSVLNGTPMTHGSIDFAPIIKWAISQGWLDPSYQLKGFQLGIEGQQGAGSMTVNHLNYDWRPCSSTGGITGGSTGGSGGTPTTTTGGSSDTSSSGSNAGSGGSTTATEGPSTGTSFSGGTGTHHSYHWTSSYLNNWHSPWTSSHSNTGASTATAKASTVASVMNYPDWLIGTHFTHHCDWS
jgi:hypothetical protein